MIKKLALATALFAATSAPALAAPVVTDASVLATTIITPTSPFGPLAEAVGAQTIGTGIDFSYGNVEGIFLDGGSTYGFCGINGNGICDLVTDVDGAIAGLAQSIYAEAGHSANGSLTLSVFDINMNLLDTALNGAPNGVYGRSTFSILRPTADIAFFRISGSDSYGVNQVVLDGLVPNNPVPEPATWAMMIGGFALAGAAMRRRRTAVSFA